MRGTLEKALLPVLVAALLVLRLSGAVDTRSAIFVFLAVEAFAIGIAGWRVFEARRRYRRARSSGRDGWLALGDALIAFLPASLARVLVNELRLFWCIWRHAFGRSQPIQDTFGYANRSITGALLVILLVSAPAEILILHLLVPWDWVKWTLVVLSMYGLLWFIGFWSSLHVLPHRLELNGIRLHYGVLAEAFVPYGNIAEVVIERVSSPDGREGLTVTTEASTGYIAVGSRTDLGFRLRAPIALQGFLGTTEPVGTIRVAADDPVHFAAKLREKALISNKPR